MEKENKDIQASLEGMPRTLCIVLTIVFVGILLSFAVNILLSSYFVTDDYCKDYYDGKERDGMFFSQFADGFYKDPDTRDLIVSADYILYGNLQSDSVLLGKNGFLFDVYDAESGYNYIEDYVGESHPDEEYLASLAKGIAEARRPFIEAGSECAVVVIPNAQTVYGELMPEYFGDISDNTVLKRLSAYMKSNGCDGYVDMTDVLVSAKADGQLYNNTENSLNSLGAYYVYRALIDAIPEAERGEMRVIERGELELAHHYTEGKALARRAGIESLHFNRTVSVDFGFPQNYSIFPRVNGVEKTYNTDFSGGNVVLLECINEWDKIMLGDYFSNSFRTVGCRVGATDTKNLFETIKPDITYIFVHEYQLSMFADEN